ncbi:hypothetical protein [Pseudomonas serbica]|jgi:hypothetical protein
MPGSLTPTLPDLLKKQIKRVLTYWTQMTVTLGFFGAGIGLTSLYVYTRAIGRLDLFMAAIDSKSALAIWILLVVLTMMAYIFILTATTWLYGVSVSQFDRYHRKHHKIACWLLIPLMIGFGVFTLLGFFYPTQYRASVSVSIIALTTIGALAALFCFKPFRLLICLNTSRTVDGKKIFFLICLAGTLVFTVIAAVFSTSLILNTYVGDDTAEAVKFVALFSWATSVLSLVPTLIFYTTKGDIIRRVAFGCTAAGFLFLVFLLFARGTMTSITYMAAGNLEIRQVTSARFVLDDQLKLEDFDNLQWRTRLHKTNRVEIEAFQLFSFGDVLLLCPEGLLDRKLNAIIRYTKFCIATRNSKVSRKPLRPKYYTRPMPKLTWQEHADRWLERRVDCPGTSMLMPPFSAKKLQPGNIRECR